MRPHLHRLRRRRLLPPPPPQSPGRAGRGRRVGDLGGANVSPGAPGGDGWLVLVHDLGGLLGVAMAARQDDPGRDQRAQEAGQGAGSGASYRHRRILIGGCATDAASTGDGVSDRIKDPAAHRGEEGAAQGLVSGSALQRRIDTARVRSVRVGGWGIEYVDPNREALPWSTSFRWLCNHRALGGSCSACSCHAEGKREREESAHRFEYVECFIVCVADSNWI